MHAFDVAVEIDLDQLNRSDFADHLCADHIAATLSLANRTASPILPMTSGLMPNGSRHAIIPVGVVTISAQAPLTKRSKIRG